MTGSISEVIVRMRDIEESTDPRDGFAGSTGCTG
jgi:hypothetical protein